MDKTMPTKNQITKTNLVELFDKRNFQIYVSLFVIFIFYLFYITQKLFFVNNLNDFGEYFLRASQWANGDWYWGSGNDKLLSMFEYLPIKIFSNDFFSIYNFTRILIISYLMLASLIFLIRKNAMLPDFRYRILIILLLLSMPFFIVESTTVEQGILLTASLLLFISTYNLTYMGFVGLLAYLSRPEGLIIVPLYLVFFLTDRTGRKKILINFISFLVIFGLYKWLDTQLLNPGTTIISSYESQVFSKETFNGTENVFVYMLNAFIRILKIPVILFIYVLSICQNYFMVLFFLIGLLLAWKDKKMLIFYAILFFYVFMGYLRVAFKSDLIDISLAYEKFRETMVFFNHTIKISNGYEPELSVIGHSRYFLFLYPAVAAFIIMGINYSFNIWYYFSHRGLKNYSAKKTVQKGKMTKKNTVLHSNQQKSKINDFFHSIYSFPDFPVGRYLAMGIIILFLINNLYAYSKFSEKYEVKNQLRDEHFSDYYHIALKIRENHSPNDLVMITNVCNCDDSFIQIFEVFSGTRFLIMNMCENCQKWPIINHPDNKGDIDMQEIKTLNPALSVVLDYVYIDYTKSFNPATVEQTRRLFEEFDLSMLDSLKVKYIVSQQDLNRPNLNLLLQKNMLRLYQNTGIIIDNKSAKRIN